MNLLFLLCTYTCIFFCILCITIVMTSIYSCVSRPLAIVCTISVYFVLIMLMLPLTGPYAFSK